MPVASIAGIHTRYELIGSGPPLLLFSPGGFDATIEKWKTQSIYARIKLLEQLPARYSCIMFDRRECGQSGGRVEPVAWSDYAEQAKGLLDQLGIAKAHILGGCMGVSAATTFGVKFPDAALSLILFWPVGGARYRLSSQERFSTHLAYVQEHGLGGVVALSLSSNKSFGEDPRGGPWVAVIRRDPDFARTYAALDVGDYKLAVVGMCRGMFARDTAPGPEPEDMLRLRIPVLVVPGKDNAHATSAARYLEECLPGAEYWDAAVDELTEATTSAMILDFLGRLAAR